MKDNSSMRKLLTSLWVIIPALLLIGSFAISQHFQGWVLKGKVPLVSPAMADMLALFSTPHLPTDYTNDLVNINLISGEDHFQQDIVIKHKYIGEHEIGLVVSRTIDLSPEKMNEPIFSGELKCVLLDGGKEIFSKSTNSALILYAGKELDKDPPRIIDQRISLIQYSIPAELVGKPLNMKITLNKFKQMDYDSCQIYIDKHIPY